MPKNSTYLEFSRQDLGHFPKENPFTLEPAEIKRFQTLLKKVSVTEIEEIYLPLAQLLNIYFRSKKELYKATEDFLGHLRFKAPYIIGISGSVSVGKSTTSQILQALLSRQSAHHKVDIVNTDGFLFPNKILKEKNLMDKKGFPESYNLPLLIKFLSKLKAGKTNLKIPVYSHRLYDIMPDTYQTINQPDIVIVEGLNTLQGCLIDKKKTKMFVSDFFDFSIFVDAKIEVIKSWFLDRFILLRKKAQKNKKDFFYQFTQMSYLEALTFAEMVWKEINERNLQENILPYKHRARLILMKNQTHAIEKVFLRKL